MTEELPQADAFELSSRLGLTFNPEDILDSRKVAGELVDRDLWKLSLADLDKFAQKYDSLIRGAATRSFLRDNSKENKAQRENQLRLDIIVRIIGRKQADIDKATLASEAKRRKEQAALIKEARAAKAFEGMSDEELDKILAE